MQSFLLEPCFLFIFLLLPFSLSHLTSSFLFRQLEMKMSKLYQALRLCLSFFVVQQDKYSKVMEKRQIKLRWPFSSKLRSREDEELTRHDCESRWNGRL